MFVREITTRFLGKTNWRVIVPEKTRIARMIHFSGRVQGVGFRYTASSIARAHRVMGWVSNLADGRVQLVIEGTEADVQNCLQAIRQYWGRKISVEEIEDSEVAGYLEFEIR
jgi:acylphosphatase